jgi:hypothetical protein
MGLGFGYLLPPGCRSIAGVDYAIFRACALAGFGAILRSQIAPGESAPSGLAVHELSPCRGGIGRGFKPPVASGC